MSPTYRTKEDLNVRSGPGTAYPTLQTLPKGFLLIAPDIMGWLPIIMTEDDGTESVSGWVSAKYLEPVPEAEAAPTPPAKPTTGEPPWITWAKNKLGIHEVAGAGDNPEIVSWFKFTTVPESMYHDSTAWCAIFVNAALFQNDKQGDRDALAVDFLKWGKNVDDDPQPGDVAVFEWSNGEHHVAFVLSVTDDKVNVIGGNQSDAVTKASFPRDNVIGFRRPV